MPRFASNKYAKGISDRSGREYPLKTMILEWNGLLVGPDEFEAKQPQLSPPRIQPDPQALRISRPARTEPPVEVLLGFNPFRSGTAGSTTITITQPGHGFSTGDITRFRNSAPFDGFSISMIETSSGFAVTVVTSSTYTITATGGETATSADTLGGGGDVSSGPVTVEA